MDWTSRSQGVGIAEGLQTNGEIQLHQCGIWGQKQRLGFRYDLRLHTSSNSQCRSWDWGKDRTCRPPKKRIVAWTEFADKKWELGLESQLDQNQKKLTHNPQKWEERHRQLKTYVSHCPQSYQQFTSDSTVTTKSIRKWNSTEQIWESHWLYSRIHEAGTKQTGDLRAVLSGRLLKSERRGKEVERLNWGKITLGEGRGLPGN